MTASPRRAKASLGPALAHILRGCWRVDVAPLGPDDAPLSEAHVSALIGSGAGAGAWRRLRGTEAAGSDGARALQALQLKQALDARVQHLRITTRLESLRALRVESLLVKGWATARTYPEAGMRALGDVDLLIREADRAAVEPVFGVLGVPHPASTGWDVKTRVPASYGLGADELFEHRQSVFLNGTRVDVPCAEHHLRIVCLHFLRHGAWRPLWACDIAVALETRPDDFSWPRCLGNDARIADHIACALGIVHHTLGARVEGTPVERRARHLPSWLVPAVLDAWDAPEPRQHLVGPPFLDQVRAFGWPHALSRRWPHPIEAAIEQRLPLDWPPAALQLATASTRAWRLLRHRGRHPRS